MTPQVPESVLARVRGSLPGPRNSGNGPSWYVPRDGRAVLRILPGLGEDPDQFVRVRGEHWGLDGHKGGVVCPRITDNAGLACPICEAVAMLAQGDEGDQAVARKLRVRIEYIVNILDRDNPSAGVQVWGMPPSVWAIVRFAVEGPALAAVWDAETGHDFAIVRRATGPVWSYEGSRFRDRASPLADDPVTLRMVLDSATPLDQAFAVPTVEEIDQLLSGTQTENGEDE